MVTSNEKEFKVGDIVWDNVRYGKGIITDVSITSPFPITVQTCRDNEMEFSYTLDGKYCKEEPLPTLYHQPYTITLQEIPEELPEVGTPVYCWDNGASGCNMSFFVRKCDNGRYVVSSGFPLKSIYEYTWDNISLTLPDKFK